MSANEVSFGQAVQERGAVMVYGLPVSGMGFKSDYFYSGNSTQVAFAQIKAFRVPNLPCVHLPRPWFFAVLGSGEELTEPECGFSPGSVRRWQLPLDANTVALEPNSGSVGDLLQEMSLRGIDGGLSIENPHVEGTKLCATIHIWAKISVIGISKNFDERIPVCIDLASPCITVWDIGWANLQICFQAPNKLCGKVCVGALGFSKCWDQCVAIPLMRGGLVAGSGCECAA